MTKTLLTHSIGNFEPADYEQLGIFYQGASEDMEDAYQDAHAEVEANLTAHGKTWDDVTWHHSSGGCAQCGSHFAHGALFLHTASGDVVPIGHTCAANFGFDDREALLVAKDGRLRAKAREGVLAREKFLAEHDGLEQALQYEHHITRDINSQFHRKDLLSEKQVALVLRIFHEDWAAPKEIAGKGETPEKVSVPQELFEGRHTLAGRIVTTKWQESQFGEQLKGLLVVTTDDGEFKLWGSVPSAIWDVETGDEVQFTARVDRAPDDSTFGFWSRPTKATITTTTKENTDEDQ